MVRITGPGRSRRRPVSAVLSTLGFERARKEGAGREGAENCLWQTKQGRRSLSKSSSFPIHSVQKHPRSSERAPGRRHKSAQGGRRPANWIESVNRQPRGGRSNRSFRFLVGKARSFNNYKMHFAKKQSNSKENYGYTYWISNQREVRREEFQGSLIPSIARSRGNRRAQWSRRSRAVRRKMPGPLLAQKRRWNFMMSALEYCACTVAASNAIW